MQQSHDFSTITHAKCILAGEHAVMRGGPAIVMPIMHKNIHLSFSQRNDSIVVEHDASGEGGLLELFRKTLEFGLKLLDKDPGEAKGEFRIKSNITIGSGIGFSSALCVAVARWLVWKGWVPEKELFNFACRLENLYHGKSSGLDIVGSISEHPVFFQTSAVYRQIVPEWHPNLYLSFSGETKKTQEAVGKVSELKKSNPQLAAQIDIKMKESVLLVEQALVTGKELRLRLMAEGLRKANECFEGWGLITPNMQEQIKTLQSQGALAVKPTGAGDGGFILSLWDKTPPQNLNIELMPLKV